MRGRHADRVARLPSRQAPGDEEARAADRRDGEELRRERTAAGRVGQAAAPIRRSSFWRTRSGSTTGFAR